MNKTSIKKINQFTLLVAVFSVCPLVGCGEKYDSIDNGETKSGFVISVDAENGCQYLSRTGSFHLTPRMDMKKKQICELNHIDYSSSKKLEIMHDFGTGCEYVSAGHFTRSTPTPRLAPNGEQICAPKPKNKSKI